MGRIVDQQCVNTYQIIKMYYILIFSRLRILLCLIIFIYNNAPIQKTLALNGHDSYFISNEKFLFLQFQTPRFYDAALEF